ncbi:MAG: MazG nucleotide pyrophosphohydrolase [Candidatus Moranbacteria bacterium GW2011_GWC1_45_18]|nr:MAG: MazG nucleotide pyrophosphohydrolase [Candidatus Moranbacteria bacterium GW2011_GWC2_40_12]KKT34068.1 MAG: MazG nucleotide pyrophosphohydrolase [Candidatus Moranbacteria bacterium GW2011_GWF2_44_10]KKT71803.1 MAG: MazG nucleotide pyrophosphohydrolase [Candidatus Moranbacteria bacterium GW2011_GWF1_44_4]KKU00106.1 MAG: MazG nucleotide pyrophosphohydrolase [Candidatus Moranbacteria bacterium GW2011_GWC1_45_18]OGI24703.1 MAG: nucleotide pyrophosphohydrolase [Candidatus Moranbacteria bacter
MELNDLIQKAVEVREKYGELEMKKYGKKWTNAQIAQGFVGDIGDLMKLVMAKEGIRDIKNINEKLEHELADCLWSILVLANNYGIDLEKSFLKNMEGLEMRISKNDG